MTLSASLWGLLSHDRPRTIGPFSGPDWAYSRGGEKGFIMQTLSAEIKVTDRFGVNPIRWKIYIEAQMGNANLYNAFLQSGSWGKRYRV